MITEVSLLEAFERSELRSFLEGMRRSGDIFHTNSVEILTGKQPGRASWQSSGNLLLSMLFLDTICVVDQDRGEVVWALRGAGKNGELIAALFETRRVPVDYFSW